MLDWEKRIEEICDQLEIDPEVYNDDDNAKEMVAKLLGFPSFACFSSLPESSAIIDGRGILLLEGHKMQQASLSEACVYQIKQNYLSTLDELDLERAVNHFIKYLEEHFDNEFATVALLNLQKVMKDVYPIDEFKSFEKYEKSLKKILESI